MENVMERIQAHFAALGRNRIEVPEWGAEGVPLAIESTPMTVADRGNVYRFAKNNSLEFLVRVIVLKAEDANCKPIFTKDDVFKLLHYADARVVERVANAILGYGAPDGNELGN